MTTRLSEKAIANLKLRWHNKNVLLEGRTCQTVIRWRNIRTLY